MPNNLTSHVKLASAAAGVLDLFALWTQTVKFFFEGLNGVRNYQKPEKKRVFRISLSLSTDPRFRTYDDLWYFNT